MSDVQSQLSRKLAQSRLESEVRSSARLQALREELSALHAAKLTAKEHEQTTELERIKVRLEQTVLQKRGLLSEYVSTPHHPHPLSSLEVEKRRS